MAHLDRDGEVAVLHLGDDENRFSPATVAELRALVAEVASDDGPGALVTTASGKFWSNGLDLAWLADNGDQLDELLVAVHHLFADVLSLPVPTVAAIQGHAFAAGAMLAACHDLAVMRADRGFWCVPEVDLGMEFTPGMDALLAARMPHRTAHEAMVTGRRYGGHDAVAAGIVDAVADDADAVLADAVARARALAGKPRRSVALIKGRRHRDLLALLRDEDANTFGGGGLG